MNERLESINKKILEILETAHPSDEDFCDKVEAVRGLYAELNNEIKNRHVAEHDVEMEEIEREKINLERKRDAWYKRIKIIEAALTSGTFLLGLFAGIWKFNRATRKENPEFPESIDTLTNRTVVQEGLREDKPFKMPWSMK